MGVRRTDAKAFYLLTTPLKLSMKWLQVNLAGQTSTVNAVASVSVMGVTRTANLLKTYHFPLLTPLEGFQGPARHMGPRQFFEANSWALEKENKSFLGTN